LLFFKFDKFLSRQFPGFSAMSDPFLLFYLFFSYFWRFCLSVNSNCKTKYK
jgi:hypothetical protein